MSETICAISTPCGSGGIAVVRVSGEQAITLVDSLFRGKSRLADARGGTAHYGEITVPGSGETVDEVVATVFRAPHSFTGEDTVEVSCHGSMYIQQELLRVLVDAGCRLARAGEFTQRAFLNGKLDLAEAEAVADLIAAQSRAERDLALRQLKGHVSDEIKSLRERLLEFTSLIELELDFADHEELEFADRSALRELAEEIAQRVGRLTGSFKTGNAIKNGIGVAIIGETNVGKSTLLNALLQDERAIVSDIEGTTRDTVEERLTIDGMPFRIIDTAGLRTTQDTIEQMGIARSLRAAKEAQIIVHVRTSPDGLCLADKAHEPVFDTSGKTVIEVVNKADLLHACTPKEHPDAVFISAKNRDIAPLLSRLREAGERLTGTRDAATISNVRHYEALLRAQRAIGSVREGLDSGISGEFLSMDLQDCLGALGEITGQITSDEVLQNIFSHFCIGK